VEEETEYKMIAATNKVRDLMRAAIQQLESQYVRQESEAIVSFLFAERFGIERIELALNPDKRFSESQIVTLYKDLKRLKAGEPVQYVTGVARFLDMKLKVSPSVLIPRPETEELVLLSVAMMGEQDDTICIDACTGSGAIALGIKKLLPASDVKGFDVSPEAVQIAIENSSANNLPVAFCCHDLFENQWPYHEPVSCIVSNPPYIPSGEKPDLDIHVRCHEPESALFVHDEDPVSFYRRLGELAAARLLSGGLLITETHQLFGDDVAGVYRDCGLKDIIVHKDIHGKQRFVSAIR